MTMQSLLDDPTMAGTWTLEPERSSVRFISRTLWGLIPVNGRFTALSGEARFAGDGTASGRLVVQADSVRTGIGMRDRHLRGADFFDVRNHPDIVIDLTAAGGDVAATLTIRGTTLPVPLRATANRRGTDSIAVSAHADVDRTRWGVSGNMLGMMPPATALIAEVLFVR